MPAAKPTISIDPDLYEEVKADAQRRGLSFSAWVEGAIRRWDRPERGRGLLTAPGPAAPGQAAAPEGPAGG